MENSLHTDITGRLIKPGDYIAYAGLFDRSAQLRLARVVDLVITKKYDKVIPKIKVNMIHGFWFHGGPRPASKIVTLGYLERTVILNENEIPTIFKDLIAKVGKKD